MWPDPHEIACKSGSAVAAGIAGPTDSDMPGPTGWLMLPSMYTLMCIKPVGTGAIRWLGYAEQVATQGLRFVTQRPLTEGMMIDVRVLLPGVRHVVFCVRGRVEDPIKTRDEGGYRMDMTFEIFASKEDEAILAKYLEQNLKIGADKQNHAPSCVAAE